MDDIGRVNVPRSSSRNVRRLMPERKSVKRARDVLLGWQHSIAQQDKESMPYYVVKELMADLRKAIRLLNALC